MLRTHAQRKIRHTRVRSKIQGTARRPRLSVYRSGRYLWTQLIDDSKGNTLLSLSDRGHEAKDNLKKAYELGEELAKEALEIGIKEVVFDRGGYKYHGRIAKLAEGTRAGGLKF